MSVVVDADAVVDPRAVTRNDCQLEVGQDLKGELTDHVEPRISGTFCSVCFLAASVSCT